MHREKSPPTASHPAARACLLQQHSEAELASLLVTTEFLHRVPGLLKDMMDAVDWLGNTRSLLRRVEDPPPALLTAIALGPITAEEATPFQKLPGGTSMAAQMNAALELAQSVGHARELLRHTSLFGRGGSGPKQLRALSRMTPLDLVAWLLLVSSKASFSPGFSATEAMAFAVLARLEEPTDDCAQRLNTWSKRLLRLRKHVDPLWVNFIRAHLEIVSRRVSKLSEVEGVHLKVRAAVDAAAARVAATE